jgi:hypothetical protein
MAIQIFPTSPAGQAAALAVPDPKNIILDQTRFVVRSGVDYVAPVISQDDQDRIDARTYSKLTALKAMTPAQVQAWVTANVTNISQAQDAIATLAIAVGIMARQL